MFPILTTTLLLTIIRFDEQEPSASFKVGNDVCGLCYSRALVFDETSSETVCSSCGMVVRDNNESLGPEWRIYSGEDIESKSRTGMPTSLALHIWAFLHSYLTQM